MKNNFEMTWASVYRMFRVANRLVELGGELSKFDINTYKYIYGQCTDEQKKHLSDKFGHNLEFV